MSEDRINEPETEELSAIDPPSGSSGGGTSSLLDAPEGGDEGTLGAIDPPSGTSGGGN